MFQLYTKWQMRLIPYLQDGFLLLIRIHWGTGFFKAGYGKFMHLDRTVSYFQTLGLPFPTVQVLLAATVELIGGVLLCVGLGSRLVPLPLIFTMIVAYATAHGDALQSLALYPSIKPFLSANPFLFLLASLIVLLFGPGRLSLDAFRATRRR